MSEEKSASLFKKLPRLQVEGAMADHPEGYQALLSFADRLFGLNPFPCDDSRHELWETNARYGVEEVERLKAERLKRLPAEPANPEEFVVWIVDGVAEHFDVLAKRALTFAVGSAQSVLFYEQFLAGIVESIVTRVREYGPSSIPQKLLLTELRLRFRQRIAHWTAEALKQVRDSEKRKSASEAPPSLKSWGDLGIRFLSDERKELGKELAEAAAAKPGIAAPEVAKVSNEEETWNKINHRLVDLKFAEVADKLTKEYENRQAQINRKGQTNSWGMFVEMERLYVERTKEYAKQLYQIHVDVWQKSGNKKTPAFVKAVLCRAILPVLETGIATGKEVLTRLALTTRMPSDLTPLIEALAREEGLLKGEWCSRAEIEASELQLEQERLEAQEPVPMAAADVPRGPDAANVAEQKARQTVGALPVAQAAATEPVQEPVGQTMANRGKDDLISPSEKRARTVATIIKELNILKPQMFGQSDYDRLERENPNFLTFREAAKRPDLRVKVLNVQDHHRHYRLAQELAAAYHGRELSTLQTDWKRHKPKKFRRTLS